MRLTWLFCPIILAPFRPMIPVPLIAIPPSPVKVPGHSAVVTVLAKAPALYSSPEFGPYWIFEA